MKNNIDITVVILTLNEEVNITQSVSNVIGWAKDVFVLDSGSSDNTIKIAEELGAKIFYRKFDNYAKQRNYAIQELPVETEWMYFLDADEYLTEDLKTEISAEIINPTADGYLIKYRFYFMGKWIKHGAYYGTKILRLFKKGKATVDRDINEHIRIDGTIKELQNDFIHKDNKSISDWIDKHNRYSTFEAQELLNYEKRQKENERDNFANLFGTSPQRKRWIREYIWNPLLPPLSRPFIYFFYRYIFRLGFLDGRAGFIYFLLQSFMMVLPTNVKYYELKEKEKNES